MDELSLLQVLRMKGRSTGTVLAAATGATESDVKRHLDELRERGAVAGGDVVRLTPEGQQMLAALVDAERRGIDRAALEVAYRSFDEVNTEVKATVSAWQTTPDGEINDHADVDYDLRVIARLVAVHERFRPVLAELVRLVPRLHHYPVRFDHALTRVREGDHGFIARPIQDSYHTVWFELHEDLLGLLALRRADEARAGRA